MSVDDMENKHTTIFAFQADVKEEKALNNKVIRSKECCLTCGGNKRIQWLERIDGKLKIKEACIFCFTKVHTHANEVDH